MKYTVIFLILTIFFSQVTLFLFQNQSPWNKDKLNADLEDRQIETNEQTIEYIRENLELGIVLDYVNLQNLVTLFIFLVTTIACMFACAHTFIDKLFFKKFYQEPDWRPALRRGIVVSLCIISLVTLRLIAGLTYFIAIPLIALFVIIEYLMTQKNRVVQEESQTGAEPEKGKSKEDKDKDKEFKSDLTTKSFRSILL